MYLRFTPGVLERVDDETLVYIYLFSDKNQNTSNIARSNIVRGAASRVERCCREGGGVEVEVYVLDCSDGVSGRGTFGEGRIAVAPDV